MHRSRAVTSFAVFAVATISFSSITGACGGSESGASPGSPEAGTEAGVVSSCSDPAYQMPTSPSGFDPMPVVDYSATRTETGTTTTSPPDGGSPGTPQSVMWSAALTNEHGTACSGAKDMTACKAKLAALRFLPTDPAQCNSGMLAGACSAEYTVYTRGDEVGATYTREGSLAFFGPIDTAAEAYAIAAFDHYSLLCTADSGAPVVRQKVTPDGIEILVKTTNCGTQSRDELVLLVKPDGTTAIVTKTTIATGPCPAG